MYLLIEESTDYSGKCYECFIACSEDLVKIEGRKLNLEGQEEARQEMIAGLIRTLDSFDWVFKDNMPRIKHVNYYVKEVKRI